MFFGVLLPVAVLAGLIGSLSGMGGGIVLIPVLTSFGMDIKEAIAISNLSTIAVSCSAAPGYVRRHMPNLKVVAYLEVFAVIGALGGALITLVSQQQPLFLICGAALLIFGVLLWRQKEKEWVPVSHQDVYSQRLEFEGSYYDHVENRTIAYRGTHALLAGILMCGSGIVSGLVGIGGSALTVLINDKIMGLPPKVSLTMSNLIIGVMAVAGANVYLEAGLINTNVIAPVILGVPIGALLGAKWLVHLPNRVARVVFLVILIALGMEMIISGIRGFS